MRKRLKVTGIMKMIETLRLLDMQGSLGLDRHVRIRKVLMPFKELDYE